MITEKTHNTKKKNVRVLAHGPFPILAPDPSPTLLPVTAMLSYQNKSQNVYKIMKYKNSEAISYIICFILS